MIGDDANNTFINGVDLHLGKADELYIIIIQPFGVFLTQRFTVHLFVGINSIGNPFAFVLRVAGIRRVAGYYQYRLVLDLLGVLNLPGKRGQQHIVLGINRLQRVGEVDAEALVACERVALVGEVL